MWKDEDEPEQNRRKSPSGSLISRSWEKAGITDLIHKFWPGGNPPSGEKVVVNKVHGATYTLPINESDIKAEEIISGSSLQDIAKKKDAQSNRYK